VVRCFDDENVIHVAGKVDPVSDIEVIQTELCLADLGTVEKALHRHNKTARSGDKEAAKIVAILERCQTALNQGIPVRALEFSREDQPLVKPLCLITAKPAMFVANVAEDGFDNNPYLDRLREYAAKQNAPVVAICAKMEAEMADMSDEDKHPRRLQAAGAADVLHGRREGSAGLDGAGGRDGAAGRRRDPHRFRARLHPGPDHRLRRLRAVQG
jgi:ribosome-binding ATPase YchF (GTP1/OBG family)